MKHSLVVAPLLLFSASLLRAETTPEELLKAVDQMTPEQVHQLQTSLDAKMWKPVPEGFFSRLAVDVSSTGGQLDQIDLSSLKLSGGEMDVEDVGGMSVGLLWRVSGDNLRVGLRMEGWEASDSNLAPAGYSDLEMTGGSVALAANYQWIRSDSWLLWSEVALGGGGVSVDTVDTPTGRASTLRTFDETYGILDLQAGGSWRFNPMLSLFLSAGYRFAESIELEEGGESSPIDFDASGFQSRLGLGVNF